jgi:hypothetical protein
MTNITVTWLLLLSLMQPVLLCHSLSYCPQYLHVLVFVGYSKCFSDEICDIHVKNLFFGVLNGTGNKLWKLVFNMYWNLKYEIQEAGSFQCCQVSGQTAVS